MGVRVFRLLFAMIAVVFAVCVVVQFYFAGMALFAKGGDWSVHTDFAKYFEFLPVLMFILSFFGKVKGKLRWYSLGMFVLFSFQHMSVQVFSGTWVVASFHPVSGLLIAWAAFHVAWKAKGWVLKGRTLIE